MVETVECDQICAACGDPLAFGQDVYLLQVVYVKMAPDGNGGFQLNFESVLDSNGDYEYFPYFLEEVCWRKEREALQEMVHDSVVAGECMPYRFRSPICTCTACGSDITHGELVGIAHLGLLKVSDRSPDGQHTTDFEIPVQKPDIICACCMQELNSNVTTYWEEGDFLSDARKREAWSLGGYSRTVASR